MALSSGETTLTVGWLLGHGNAATTLKYAHLSDATVRETVEALAPLLSGRSHDGQGKQGPPDGCRRRKIEARQYRIHREGHSGCRSGRADPAFRASQLRVARDRERQDGADDHRRGRADDGGGSPEQMPGPAAVSAVAPQEYRLKQRVVRRLSGNHDRGRPHSSALPCLCRCRHRSESCVRVALGPGAATGFPVRRSRSDRRDRPHGARHVGNCCFEC